MSFPQTQPVDATRNGQEFWRLFTRLESSGDIYESDVSGLGFALGPSSDIDSINITYFDNNTQSRSNVVEISKDKAFIGRLDAFSSGSRQYSTGQKARLLISPSPLIPQARIYAPIGSDPNDEIVIDDIFIDFFQHFSNGIAATVPWRYDRIHFFQTALISTITGVCWFVLPYYGRRYASITLKNATADSYDIEVLGVVLNTGVDSVVGNLQVSLQGPSAVAASGGIATLEITAENHGVYDLLLVKLSTASGPGVTAGVPLYIRTSDRVG
jgi:hypothetical protein